MLPPIRGNPVRFIYVDEAGISKEDKATVVAAIVVNGDSDFQGVEDMLNEARQRVPVHLREGFISHATDVWNSHELRNGWEAAERLRYLQSLIAIPMRLHIPVVISFVRRENPGDPSGKIDLSTYHHMWAFAMCMGHADRYIREFGASTDLATIVAEDTPKRKKRINDACNYLKRQPMLVRALILERERGKIVSEGSEEQNVEYRIDRIREAVHFVAKAESPLLQVADAYAFAFRRYIYRLSFGDKLLDPMARRHLISGIRDSKLQFGTAVFARHFDPEKLLR